MELRAILAILCLVGSASALNYPLPIAPYLLIWNAPSEVCQNKHRISFQNLYRESGITFNPGDKFDGEHSTIFYPGEFGLFPFYHDGHPPPINGGLPQVSTIQPALLHVV